MLLAFLIHVLQFACCCISLVCSLMHHRPVCVVGSKSRQLSPPRPRPSYLASATALFGVCSLCRSASPCPAAIHHQLLLLASALAPWCRHLLGQRALLLRRGCVRQRDSMGPAPMVSSDSVSLHLRPAPHRQPIAAQPALWIHHLTGQRMPQGQCQSVRLSCLGQRTSRACLWRCLRLCLLHSFRIWPVCRRRLCRIRPAS